MSRCAKRQAIDAVRQSAKADREARLFQARLDQIHASEQAFTETALDWQVNKWRKICRVIYWAIVIVLSVGTVGLAFLAHLAISWTWGKPRYWIVFAILTVVSWGVYIPIHFLYKIGVAEG